MDDLTTILSCTIAAGTPMVYSICGDLVGQRTGIISLSMEGSMLCGACVGFGVAVYTQNLLLVILASAAAGAFIGLIQAYLSIDRKANMLASAFVLNFLATGLTAFFGISLLSEKLLGFDVIRIPFLSEIPVLGKSLFSQDALTYIAFLLPVAIHLVLYKTRLGAVIRSAGENPDVTEAYGYSPRRVRYGAVLFAGAMAGIGGAQMSVFFTRNWANEMINGRGFIGSSMVALCAWRPRRAYMAAYLFGLAQSLQVFFQIKTVPISPYVTMMFPYLITLAALAVTSMSKRPGMPETLKIVSEEMADPIKKIKERKLLRR